MKHYYMLVTSLPRHAADFKVQQTPISAVQLEKRLQFLSDADKIRLKNIIDVVWLSWFKPKTSLIETLSYAKPLLDLDDPFITELIIWFYNLRSIVTALRLRQSQKHPPLNPDQYWRSNLNQIFIKNWSQADFNLKNTYPWITNIAHKLAEHASDDVEDILLNLIWKHLQLIEARHYFDFAALIIYVLRWHITDYWSKFNAKRAVQHLTHFEEVIRQ